MWTSGKLSGGSAAPRAATDLPQLTRATSQARPEPVAGGGARPRPAAPWHFRAKSAAAPLPGNRPERQAGRSPGTPGASDPPPEVTGKRAPVEGKYSAGVGPHPGPSGTSPLSRRTPGAPARPSPALGFRLPPRLLNFGGRKSRPRMASPGEALQQAMVRVGGQGQGQGQGRCWAWWGSWS